MNKNLGFDPKLWESVEAIEMGEHETLKLGGHEIVIKGAKLYKSEQTGNVSLKVIVDIAGKDEQAGYFQKQFDESTNAEKKWPNGASKYFSLKEESLAYTKGFITCLEKSNEGFKFDMTKGWEQLVGLKCAGVFGLEEYEDREFKVRTTTKLVQIRSLDKLPEIKIPRVKLLDGSYVDYESYKPSQNNSNNETIEINDDALPF